jgi:hypothetical protein
MVTPITTRAPRPRASISSGGTGGSVAPRGLFAALGFVVQRYATETTGSEGADFQHRAQSWTYAGPSVDVGGQIVLPLGLALSLSGGVHVRGVVGGDLEDSGRPWDWSVSHGPGIRPRFRASMGWAF